MEKLPKISIVMSSFSRAELLRHGLRSIIRNKPDFPLEVVVVNDGLENDGTKEVCEVLGMALNIRYVFTGQRHTDKIIKRCPAIPNNISIRQATGDIVILTSPEILHLNNAISLIIQPLLENKKVISIPDFMYFDEKGTYTRLLKTNKDVDTRFLIPSTTHVQMPFFMGVWKKEIIEIGGYDEDFIGYAGEDNDFVERLVDNGCSYMRTAALIVHLNHGEHCTGNPEPNNPLWVYNKNLWQSRRGVVVRNVGKEWGMLNRTDTTVVLESKSVKEIKEVEVKKEEKPIRTIENIFTDIYKNKIWSSDETPSGTGSELRSTENIRKEIPILFKKYGIKRILDVGCGNSNWIRLLFKSFEFYLGIDVVNELVSKNIVKLGSRKVQFKKLILTDPSVDGEKELASYNFDVVILNDVLVHLSLDNIGSVLCKLRQAGIKYILATHFPLFEKYINIPTGRWGPLNMTLFPLSFPEPLELIDNSDELVVNDPEGIKQKLGVSKSLGLWKFKDVPVVNGIPKIAHLYWGKNPMSWLQTKTVTTFHKHNPDWEIRVYIPIQPFVEPKGKYVPDYTGKDYFDKVREMPYVNIVEIDMEKYGIDPLLHNILQSDIFRYLMLYEVGGLWMDFDVLWLRPISEIYKIKTKGIVSTEEMGTFICKCEPQEKFHSIGVLMSKPKHPFYKTIIDKCFEVLKNNKNREELYHQSFGTDLIDRMYPTFEDTCRTFKDVVKIPYKTFYPYSILTMSSLYKESKLERIEDPNVLCVHWFNGHRFSKEYMNSGYKTNPDSTMAKIVSMIKKGKL